MTITSFSGISEAAQQQTSSSGGSSTSGIADDFDTFLMLLLTQLENQNPLEPLDTNQFTEQLVQFAEVEQQIKQNENLELITSLNAALFSSSAVGFIGKTVTVETAQAELKNGEAKWDYAIDGQPASATFTIRDQDGAIVFSEDRPVINSVDSYTWNGRDLSGQTMPDGNYTVTIEPKDASGTPLNAVTSSTVTIDGVDFSDIEPVLKVGGQRIPLSLVTAVDG